MKFSKTAAQCFMLLLLLCAAGSIFALGSKDKKNAAPQNEIAKNESVQQVTVSGVVRLVGSSPRILVVITGENREWYVEETEKNKLQGLQYEYVTVKAHEYYQDLVYASGKPDERHYYLKDIVIINPEKQ